MKTATATPSGKLFEFFDRIVVTWLLTIFDIMILLPALAWTALAVLGSVLIIVAGFVNTLWRLALHWIPWLVHTIAHWFGLMAVLLLRYLEWLQHV